MELYNVVIWGNDNYNMLGVLRMLSHKKLEVFLLVNKKRRYCATLSKYCKKYVVAKSPNEGLDFLCNKFVAYTQKPILITTSDILAELVDKHQDDLSKYFYISKTKESGLLEKFLDKNYMTEVAYKNGINVPISYEITKNKIPQNFQLPCIIKPSKNIAGKQKDFKSMVCLTRNAVNAALANVNPETLFILQQYVKKEYEILIYGCRLNNGVVHIPGLFKKYRWSKSGDASYGLITREIPKIINQEAIATVLEKIGFLGLFSVEFGIENGKAYFYEFNLRNDGTSHYFEPAGVNLPYLHYLDMRGLPYDVNDFYVKTDVWFIDKIGDRNNINGTSLTKNSWKKQIKQCEAYKLFDCSDLKPYMYAKLNSCILFNILRKIKKAYENNHKCR